MSEEAKGSGPAQPHGAKLMIELGPLLVFVAAYVGAGIYWATGMLMGATVIALVASWKLLGRLSPVPLLTAVLVVIFGTLTFYFHNPIFIYMKPTFINLLFGVTLAAGLATGRHFLKLLLGEAFNITDEGWRKLTVRWIVFFLAVALLNELVWRTCILESWLPIKNMIWSTCSESTWAYFKGFGILPLTLIFAMSQIGLIKRYEPKAEV
jgi:intracellular septation protein